MSAVVLVLPATSLAWNKAIAGHRNELVEG